MYCPSELCRATRIYRITARMIYTGVCPVMALTRVYWLPSLCFMTNRPILRQADDISQFSQTVLCIHRHVIYVHTWIYGSTECALTGIPIPSSDTSIGRHLHLPCGKECLSLPTTCMMITE